MPVHGVEVPVVSGVGQAAAEAAATAMGGVTLAAAVAAMGSEAAATAMGGVTQAAAVVAMGSDGNEGVSGIAFPPGVGEG